MHATESNQPVHRETSGHFRIRRAFSLTELLVVIAIIVLLIGLLLVALAAVKKKSQRTDTEATMTQFANACASFWAEHGQYPGVIPEGELKAHADANAGRTPISSTENALLHLMGGYRVLSPQDALNTASYIYQDFVAFSSASNEVIDIEGAQGVWQLKIKTDQGGNAVLGDGPVINGKPYPAYFTPGANALVAVSGQVTDGDVDVKIPDLVDAWGQPIIYIRQSRDRGPVAAEIPGAPPLPQFEFAGIGAYLNSSSLGELGQNQLMAGNTMGSILTVGGNWGTSGSSLVQRLAMTTIIAHPAFYKSPPPLPIVLNGKARGAVVLISAGLDGIYFSAIDGPGTPQQPLDMGGITNQVVIPGPKVIDEFDDIRVFSGG